MNPEEEYFSYLHLYWFEQILNDYLGEIEVIDRPDISKKAAIRMYMMWAINMGFLHTFGNPEPVAGIILRPMESEMLEKVKADYFKTIYLHDFNGDVIWIDFCHAPDNTPFITDFVKKYARTLPGNPAHIAWMHAKKNAYSFFLIENLPDKFPLSNKEVIGLRPLD